MATQNSNTGFRSCYQDRWAEMSGKLYKERMARYDANVKSINEAYRQLLAKRKGV